MALIGEDFRGGWLRRLYAPANPAGLGMAVLFFVLLLALNQLLQYAGAKAIAATLFAGSDSLRDFVKAGLLAIFPASLLTAACALGFAGLRPGRPAEVLALRWPRLGPLGWPILLAGFLVVMYVTMALIVYFLGINLAEYTPGPHGESPETGSAGLVKEAMFDIANDPKLFWMVFPSLAVGAPVAEELMFRGQLFAALSQTRLGVAGTTLLTSALWALLHVTEPWLAVLMIFIMGLAFGWMLYRFGSLWVTIACHAVWNAVYALIIFGVLHR